MLANAQQHPALSVEEKVASTLQTIPVLPRPPVPRPPTRYRDGGGKSTSRQLAKQYRTLPGPRCGLLSNELKRSRSEPYHHHHKDFRNNVTTTTTTPSSSSSSPDSTLTPPTSLDDSHSPLPFTVIRYTVHYDDFAKLPYDFVHALPKTAL